jgi:hypothetical protein
MRAAGTIDITVGNSTTKCVVRELVEQFSFGQRESEFRAKLMGVRSSQTVHVQKLGASSSFKPLGEVLAETNEVLFKSGRNPNGTRRFVALSHGERIAYTVAELYAHARFDEVTAWHFSKEYEDTGLDPWTQISGIDRFRGEKNEYELDYGRTGTMAATGADLLWISKADAEKLGA